VIALVIDASTYRGTVAVFRDGALASSSQATMRGAQTEALMPAVVESLAAADVSIGRLDRVVCGEGPGSFTSLRIAGSIAKGLCLGRSIPLYAVSSLALVAAAGEGAPGSYVATLDALRDEWYAAVFERAESGAVTQCSPVTLIPRGEIDTWARSHGPIIGAARGGPEPSAASCAALFGEIDARGPVDLERWEPTYGRLAEAQVKWEAAQGRPLSG
jgi:tRNA threonylcarbamoyladenosine biosynthesis protein TsaB